MDGGCVGWDLLSRFFTTIGFHLSGRVTLIVLVYPYISGGDKTQCYKHAKLSLNDKINING